MSNEIKSLLFPKEDITYITLSNTSIHDLGLDAICKKITAKESEQSLLLRIMSQMTDDSDVTKYRCEIFDDIYHNKAMRDKLMVILDKIDFLRDYGSLKRDYEESTSTWDLLHRLEEINDYIQCVEAFYQCLCDVELHSTGLLQLREHVEQLYREHGFKELKEDIKKLKATTSDLKSITVGINLNERFEVDGIGLISINNKYFTKSNVIGAFCDMVANKNAIQDSNEWKENYKYHPISMQGIGASETLEHVGNVKLAMAHPLVAAEGIANVADKDAAIDMTKYMDRVTNHMISLIVKKLRDVLNKYVSITITDITNLIPEFLYYIRWAEYIEKLMEQGFVFTKAEVIQDHKLDRLMDAKDIYNLKLAALSGNTADEIVTNDLIFDKEHRIYILTGANRGGKTTITQAIGLLFVLSQGGIYIPGKEFRFHPVDGIYTHFPADEDKTMDLGRLGEECKRFKEQYTLCSKSSLLLLNETFSTTSFEEGYYIAKDVVKALLSKGIRTIYNTHMHKLAFDINEMNDASFDGTAASLVMRSNDGARSYKVEIAPPEGMSYAKDIAEKYGVTFEMLIES